jgi:hypothetical protein
VRVARALEELPLITAEFAAGKLSYSKVRSVTRVATPENEDKLVTLAAYATAVQVDRAVRAYRSVSPDDTETEAANARHAERSLRYDWADGGSLEGHFRIPPEIAAIFLKAVAVARNQIPSDPDEEMRTAVRTRELATTNCDALIVMADALLARETGERSSGARFQIQINVDAEVLAGDTEGTCELDGGPAIAPETARRLSCDASIVEAVHDAADRAHPSSQKAPAIPAATRRAVHARDQGCRFPDCGGRVFTHIHHVRHRAHKGGNEMANLVELCWFHHRLVHEGGWSLRFDNTGEVLAIRPNSNVLPRPAPAGLSDGHEIERANRRAGTLIDPTTCIPRMYGDRFDLAAIVTSLVSSEPR